MQGELQTYFVNTVARTATTRNGSPAASESGLDASGRLLGTLRDDSETMEVEDALLRYLDKSASRSFTSTERTEI